MKKRSYLFLLLLVLLLSVCSCASVVPTETGSAENEIGATPSEESEKTLKTLYEKAVSASEENRLAYSYGLYSRLAAEGYEDSAKKAAGLRASANATPISYVSLSVFDGFSDDSAVSDHAFIYADQNGTPRVLYAVAQGNDTVAKEFVPDPTITGVISFKFDGLYYNKLCVCIKEDGSLRVFYSSKQVDSLVCDCNEGDKCPHELAKTYKSAILSMIPLLEGEKNVVDFIISSDGALDYALIHSDNTASFYHKGAAYDDAIKQSGDFSDVVDFSYDQGNVGVSSRGTLINANGKPALDPFKNVHMIDDYFILDGGRAHYAIPGSSSIGEKENAVYAASAFPAYFFISSDGTVYDSNDGKLGNSDKVALVYGSRLLYVDKKTTSVSVGYVIGTDGKLISMELYDESAKDAWQKTLFGALKNVTVNLGNKG